MMMPAGAFFADSPTPPTQECFPLTMLASPLTPTATQSQEEEQDAVHCCAIGPHHSSAETEPAIEEDGGEHKDEDGDDDDDDFESYTTSGWKLNCSGSNTTSSSVLGTDPICPKRPIRITSRGGNLLSRLVHELQSKTTTTTTTTTSISSIESEDTAMRISRPGAKRGVGRKAAQQQQEEDEAEVEDPGTTTEELADTDAEDDDVQGKQLQSQPLAVCSQGAEDGDDFDEFDMPEFDLCGHSPAVQRETQACDSDNPSLGHQHPNLAGDSQLDEAEDGRTPSTSQAILAQHWVAPETCVLVDREYEAGRSDEETCAQETDPIVLTDSQTSTAEEEALESTGPSGNVDLTSSANSKYARPGGSDGGIVIDDTATPTLRNGLCGAKRNRSSFGDGDDDHPIAGAGRHHVDTTAAATDTIEIDDDDLDLFSWDHQGYRCTAVTDNRRVRPSTPIRVEDLKPVADLTDEDFEAIASIRQQNRREALRFYTLKYLPHFVPIEDLPMWQGRGHEFDYHGQFATTTTTPTSKSGAGQAKGGDGGRRSTQQERQYGTAKAYTQPKKRARGKKPSVRRRRGGGSGGGGGSSRFKRKSSKKKA